MSIKEKKKKARRRRSKPVQRPTLSTIELLRIVPLAQAARLRGVHRVAELLRGQELGDGAVGRACRSAQSEVFTQRPQMLHNQPPKPRRKMGGNGQSRPV
ncbi:MAG TPA: hypothetical protein VFC26_01405 [Verrucomicrobiae bacterium]|jgi:hypothetical protein|nr:hypothetical protein [Verrucomicrobiae bacterium]